MSFFTVFKISTGEVMRVLSCPEAEVLLQIEKGVHSYIHGDFQNDKFYIKDGLPALLPSKPSFAHTFNWQTKQWEDLRTLADFKEIQWDLIKQARTNAEYGGFTWDSSFFDSDAISQNRITSAVTLAQSDPAFSVAWVLADNSVRTLNQTDMLAVGAALGQHVALQFNKSIALREAIKTATNAAQLAAIKWLN